MPKFVCKISKKVKNIQVNVFECNLDDAGELKKLQDRLLDKIGKMKIHRTRNYEEMLKAPGINEQFAKKLTARISEITTPARHKIIPFDVRRSRVTEFMSQILLGNELGCVFYDVADKRINLEITDVDNHVRGVDVTGLKQSKNGSFKFVVCEVKASQEAKIPCGSSNELHKDTKKIVDDQKNRLTKEILRYIEKLENIKGDDEIESIMNFLFNILGNSSSKKILWQSVIFFPFLIRRNEQIIKDENIADFTDIGNEPIQDKDIQGIIWHFNKDIDSFCLETYQKALEK